MIVEKDRHVSTNIIDESIPHEKSRELVRKIIPILIRWAKQGITTNTYDNLIKEIGYSKFSGIARQLDYVHLVVNRLCEITGESIPTLNALIKSKSNTNNLPSSGFRVVYPSYETMSDIEKKIFVTGVNKKAIDYEHWDWVLSSLGLTPSIMEKTKNEEAIRSGSSYSTGGEGEHHKKLKEHIYNHPEAIGIQDFKMREMEHILLSGDRLDLYFELNDGSKIAVEIKPSISSDADVMRGLFQCVKYKSILDAEDKIHGERLKNSAILVMGGELSLENRKIKDILGVSIVENFKD